MQQQLLIIDDETDLLHGLKRMLAREFDDLVIETEASAGKGLARISAEPVDVVLLDIQMPEINGLDLLEAIKKMDPDLTVIMMTGYGSIEMAVAAIKGGAYDFITKPFDMDALVRTITKGLEHNRLLRENINLRRRICEKEPLADFVGQSLPLQRLYHGIRTTARTDYTVLIRGESGTGKELTARAIHSMSNRRGRPMVMVNCPAIPEHLLESELFGHKKGSFTGADNERTGLFLEADGSTICLDEIGDIPVSVQIKLLRVLQEHEIRPIGSSRTRSVNVRIIASTNSDLEKKIQEGTFREDLFYRLNVVSLQTPSLKEIRDDIPLLIDHFTRQVCRELELPEKRFSPESVEELMQRDWPGNVRELQNIVRGAVLFCPDTVIGNRYLRSSAGSRQQAVFSSGETTRDDFEPYKDAKERAIAEFTRGYVVDLLDATAGNVSKAAQFSGLTRAALQKIMRRYDILSQDFRDV